MSLGCNIEEVKKNAFNSVKKIIEGNSTTIKMNNNGVVTFNHNKSNKYTNRAAAYGVAQSKINAVKKWVAETIGPKFINDWITVYQNNNEVWLQYQFPKYVENAYKRKFAIMKQREVYKKKVEEARIQQIEDAKRAGIDESEFDDDYMYFNYQDDFDALGDPDAQLSDPDSPELNNPENTKKQLEVSNDFNSYYNHKVALLNSLENKMESYKIMNKHNFGSEQYKKDMYRLHTVINKLKDEILNLDVKDINNVMEDVVNELDYLNEMIDTLDTDVFKTEDIISRIDFLHQAINGTNLSGEKRTSMVKWDGSEYDNFSEIKNKITDLNTKLKENQEKIVKDLLDKDIIYQAHKDQFTADEINKLFKDMSDINHLQALFLGINSNNDSIVSTLLNTTFQTNVQKTKQSARPINEALKRLDKILTKKKFNLDNFLEKDEDGIDTGNIIHKYNKKYFSKLYEYYNINKKFNGAKKDNIATIYNQKISWLKQNTEVIDFRKLSYFKDVYGEEYPEFFTFSDQEMTEYESKMRKNLGKIYDHHIQDLEKKLAEFEEYKNNEQLKENNKWASRNIASNSPWIFVQNFYSDNQFNSVHYQSGSNTYNVFNNSKHIEFVPKRVTYDIDTMQTIETGFYNKEFDNIESDSDAFEYWSNLRDLYSKHINPTYAASGQSVSALSWAKIERGFLEEMKKSEGIKGFFKNLYNEVIKGFKNMWVENSLYTDKTGIRTNYNDNTKKQIDNMKKALEIYSVDRLQNLADKEGVPYKDISTYTKGLKGSDISKAENKYKNDLLDKIARKKILSNYSTDLTKTTLALSELASLHKARTETQFIADMLLNYAQTIKKKDGVTDRHLANKKLNSWVDTNIYNKRSASRGNIEDEFSSESKWNIHKVLSKTEKDLLEVLRTVQNDSTDNVENYYFMYNGQSYTKRGKDFFITEDKKKVPITKEVFEKNLESYFNEQVSSMGISITPSGIIQGIMQVLINKALALNPVSGIFNRSEGMFSNMIRDNMGDFWTRGNLKYAKRFLVFANVNKFAGTKLSLQTERKMLQMQTYQQLLEELALFQDKKNELDRKDKESKYNKWKEKLNIFQFAVDNPEFKNQSEIILSMLMDVRIKDKNGKEHKFFDGSGFPAYKPGTLELRDEFKTEENQGWENFAINDNPSFNQFFVQKVKIEDTIKRTQGNYASLDSISIQDNNWGKFLMLFMRWFPEHVNQRFGRRDIDIIQGKKAIVGRYRGVLSNSNSASIFGTLTAGLAFGPIGLAFGAGVSIVPFVAKHMYGMYVSKDSDVQDLLLDLKTNAGFLQEIAVQTLNMPLKATYSSINLDGKIENKLLNNSKLTPEQVIAARGVAQESAIMISQLLVMVMLKSLLFNPDDDDKDTRRQLHNFVDNQGNRSINSILSWSNPSKIVTDNSKLALLRYVDDILKLIQFSDKYFNENNGTNAELTHNIIKVQPFIAVPTTLSKAAFNKEYPGLDKREYQNAQWFDKLIKGQEWMNNKILENNRSKLKELYEKELRDMYEGKDIPEDEIDELIERKVRKKMRKSDISKKKNETATDALDRIDFEEKIEEAENK